MEEKSKNADGSYSHSLDSDIVYLDGPVDRTVRPCRPEHLPHLRAEREKILTALKAGFRPRADTEELAEAERLRLIGVYDAAIAREAAGQA
jgi:hypothetical protein